MTNILLDSLAFQQNSLRLSSFTLVSFGHVFSIIKRETTKSSKITKIYLEKIPWEGEFTFRSELQNKKMEENKNSASLWLL